MFLLHPLEPLPSVRRVSLREGGLYFMLSLAAPICGEIKMADGASNVVNVAIAQMWRVHWLKLIIWLTADILKSVNEIDYMNSREHCVDF